MEINCALEHLKVFAKEARERIMRSNAKLHSFSTFYCLQFLTTTFAKLAAGCVIDSKPFCKFLFLFGNFPALQMLINNNLNMYNRAMPLEKVI